MILVRAPTDQVAANHFARSRNKLQIRMLRCHLPGVIGSIHDVGIANVLIEVPHTIIESNDTCQR